MNPDVGRGGGGGGERVRRMKTVWPCLGLAVESPWLVLGDPVLCTNGLRKQSSGLISLLDLDGWLLVESRDY